MASGMKTAMSKNLAQASLRAKSLYRKAMRAAPAVVVGYELECTPATLKQAVRDRFKAHQNVTEPPVIDVLCYKGEQELQETLNMWKTKAHVQKYVDAQQTVMSAFAEEFFKGHVVEEWTWPPADYDKKKALFEQTVIKA